MENCKTFCKAQTASCLKIFIQSPPIPPLPDETLVRLGNNFFIRRYIEIYRHLLSKCFKNAVLGRQEIVVLQIFFLASHRNMFAGKFIKSERFLAVFREHIIFKVKWVKVCKMSEVFLAKLCCKLRDLFC